MSDSNGKSCGETTFANFRDVNRRSLMKFAGLGAVGAATIGIGGTTAVSASSETDRFEPTKIDADPESGFNYPYFLHAPDIDPDEERPILVLLPWATEPSDDLSTHVEEARKEIEGAGEFFARELGVPVLTPVLPVFEADNESSTAFSLALDAETLALEGTELERIDKQVLAAIDDATDRLANDWNPVADEVLVNGQWFSGYFANRFSALHPNRVRSVSTGDFGGTAILPTTEAQDGTSLPYPVGVANLSELVGEPLDSGAFSDVDQFLYQTEDLPDLSDNFAVWNQDQQELVSEIFGDEAFARLEHSESVYNENNISAKFTQYGDSEFSNVLSDVVWHHLSHIDITKIANVERPEPGAETVAFQAVVGSVADQLDVHVSLTDGTIISEEPVTLQQGEKFDGEITVDRPLEKGDRFLVLLLESGSTAREDAVDSRFTTVNATTVGFQAPPTDGDETVNVSGTLSEGDLSPELELRLGDSDGNEIGAEPISVGVSYGGGIALTRPLSEGETITALIQPMGEYDPESAIESTTTTVEESLGLDPAFSFEPESPDVETEVTFDASDTEPAEDARHFLWDFTDNQEFDADGIEASHTFTEPGEHEVQLDVEFEINGEAFIEQTTQTIHVREGCFIATAACGTPDHGQVETLRAFRDQTLKGNVLGEFAIRAYYNTSPPIADWIAESRVRRELVRTTVVRPAARVASALGLTSK